MYYITVKQSPRYHQMTLEEFLLNPNIAYNYENKVTTGTRTYQRTEVSDLFKDSISVPTLVSTLEKFNKDTEYLREYDRHDLYRSFKIPKKKGGQRPIDAPNEELMGALRRLKSIFETSFTSNTAYESQYCFNGALYHTNAFAYIKKRSTIDAVKMHQANESYWFAKYDLHNFFGSTTMEFVINMLSMIFPFSEVIKDPCGKDNMERALELAFLDGGLPQGTPISPLITNIIMIPVDYILTKTLRDFNSQSFIYTRYADDFIISSKYTFRFKDIEKLIINTLASFEAPFTINESKTRYGSRSGSNWMLGVLLNNDNVITVGSAEKRRFKAKLFSYMADRENGNPWPIEDIQELEGLRSYYTMVEGRTIDDIVKKIGIKFGKDIRKCIKEDLHVQIGG